MPFRTKLLNRINRPRSRKKGNILFTLVLIESLGKYQISAIEINRGRVRECSFEAKAKRQLSSEKAR